MNTETHHYHYAQQAAERQRHAMTAILASHRRRAPVTVILADVTANTIADQRSSASPVLSKENAPPKPAKYLLYLFLSREDREAMFGCLEEQYRTEFLPEFGKRGAQFLYWCEVGRSIWPVISGSAGRLLWWLIQKFTS
jgi:hypothetical protein